MTPSRMESFLKYQGPALLLMILIFIASSFSTLPGPRLGFRFEDKWHHFLVFGILGYLLVRAIYWQSDFPFWKRNSVWLAMIIGILYGISDEYHQSFVPGRFSEVGDVIADAVGVILGAWLYHYRNLKNL